MYVTTPYWLLPAGLIAMSAILVFLLQEKVELGGVAMTPVADNTKGGSKRLDLEMRWVGKIRCIQGGQEKKIGTIRVSFSSRDQVFLIPF
jgi:hypothetical protein